MPCAIASGACASKAITIACRRVHPGRVVEAALDLLSRCTHGWTRAAPAPHDRRRKRTRARRQHGRLPARSPRCARSASTRPTTTRPPASSGRPGDRRRRGGALHAHQARQAAGAVLGLGAAVPRDRLLPARRRRSRWPTSTTSPTRTTRSCCSARIAGDADDRRCRCEPGAPTPRRVGVALGSAVPVVDRQRAAAARRRRAAPPRRSASAASARDGPFRWHFVDHHLAHAASAFLAAPFERCAVMTLDGRGERGDDELRRLAGTATSNGIGQVHMPHSLGLLYEKVTQHLGFLHSSDEYKVMALASFGKPRYVDEFRDIVRAGARRPVPIDAVRLDGRASVRRGSAAGRSSSGTSTSPARCRSCSRRPCSSWPAGCTAHRRATTLHGRRRRAQLRDERAAARPRPVRRDLGPAGGGRRRHRARRGALDRSRARAARGDGRRRLPRWTTPTSARATTTTRSRHFLRWSKLPLSAPGRRRRRGRRRSSPGPGRSAGSRGGWSSARGRSARARSSPRRSTPTMQARLNEIKDREDFRPVAPVVLEEEADRTGSRQLRRVAVHAVRLRRPAREGADRIPAVCHIDGTRARPDGAAAHQHPLYYDLHQGVPGADRRAGAGQHLVQHARRADRLHARATRSNASGPRRSTRW